MKKLPLLALVLAFASTVTIATAGDLPEEVLVQTDMVSASEFSPWKPKNPSGFAGTYSGDVSGDTSGNLVIKVTKKGEDDEASYTCSGTYRESTAGLAPAVVTFTNAIFHETDDEFSAATSGPVTVIFVTLDGKKGVVIGGAFIPKE